MPPRLPARAATVLVALALGLTSVPELTSTAAADEVTTPPDAAETAVPSAAPDVATYDEVLPEPLSGEQVLDDRPDLVPVVAESTGLGVAATARLLEDETVRVSTTGRAYVVDAAHTPTDTGGERGARASVAPGAIGSRPATTAAYPTSQTFQLQSRPGAARTIFIDADGATVGSRTFWRDNAGYAGGTVPGLNLEGSASTFTAAEHAWIQEVWREVAEAYAPFDVNVTTLDRGQGAWQRSTRSDTTWGTRVVVTSSASVQRRMCTDPDTGAYAECGGVAAIGAFGTIDPRDYLQPAWAFVDSRITPSLAAQTISHEVGHTLGLGHDGQGEDEYTFGSTLWGPIMGGGMARAISQWSRGEYLGATEDEDDLAVIASQAPLVADDHGNTPATATPLGGATRQDVAGLIGSPADTDVVRLDLGCRGPFDAYAAGIGPQTTLDTRLELLDVNGATVQANDPTSWYSAPDARTGSPVSTGMDARVQAADLPAGTYFLRVDGVGRGSALSPSFSGYSDYGSLGTYRLTVGACGDTSAAAPAPVTPPAAPAAPAASKPSAPRSVKASPGRRGGAPTVRVRWSVPSTTGGGVKAYRVTAYALDRRGRVRATYTTGSINARTTSVELRLPRGRYVVGVQAQNAAGTSAPSARSGRVTSR